jgi:hypothetical protein
MQKKHFSFLMFKKCDDQLMNRDETSVASLQILLASRAHLYCWKLIEHSKVRVALFVQGCFKMETQSPYQRLLCLLFIKIVL